MEALQATASERRSFDLIVFDLDGTLVASDGVWVSLLRAAAVQASSELGLSLSITARDALEVFGGEVREALLQLVPDPPAAWIDRASAHFQSSQAGYPSLQGTQPMSGAAELLPKLKALGYRLALATNAGQGYLEAMLDLALAPGLRLADCIAVSRCLSSPGIRSKSQMVRQILECTGTRSAVMVGDREGDREAAHQNGIPHVHFAGGFAERYEGRKADAVLLRLFDLPALLGQRATSLLQLAAELAARAFVRALPREPRVGLFGAPFSGKSLLAIDLQRALLHCGFDAVLGRPGKGDGQGHGLGQEPGLVPVPGLPEGAKWVDSRRLWLIEDELGASGQPLEQTCDLALCLECSSALRHTRAAALRSQGAGPDSRAWDQGLGRYRAARGILERRNVPHFVLAGDQVLSLPFSAWPASSTVGSTPA